MSLAANNGGGGFSCTTTPTKLTNGTATFSGCSYTIASATAYTLTATAGSHTATANTTVSAAAASQVAWITQPGTSTAGSNITGPPTVEVEDPYNNPVSGATVTIAVTTGPGAFTGGSTTSLTSGSNGQAAFSSLVLDTAGTTYTLTASDGLVHSVASNTFTVNAATANKFVFTTSAVSGQASNTASLGPITVQAQDQYGNPTKAGAGGILVNLSSSSSGTYIINTTQNAIAPIGATTLTIASGNSSVSFYYGDTKADGPTITASGSLTLATQQETITASTTNDELVFVQQPPNGFSGLTISPAVTVQVQDGFGNNVSYSSGEPLVTLSPSSGTISGGGSATANSSGLATFTGLMIGTAGANLTLTASATSLTSGVSGSFIVSVLVNNGATLTDTASDGGSGVASVSYYYCSGFSGGCSPGTLIGTSTTAGSWSLTWSSGQPSDGQYQVVAEGTDNLGNVSGPTASIPVTVDNSGPTGSVTYTNGYVSTTSVSVSFSATDSISGVNSSTGLLKRASATLSGGSCGTFSTYSQIGTTGLSSPYVDNSVTSGNCYRYEYVVSNYAGVQSTITSVDIVEVDTALPTVSVSFPANNGSYNSTTWTPPISGSATDAVSGISGTSSINLVITQSSSGNTWNGSAFASGTNTVHPTVYNSGTGAWTYTFPSSNFPANGTYTVAVKATDNAGNTSAASTNSFTYSNVPTASSVANITTAGGLSSTTSTFNMTSDTTYVVGFYQTTSSPQSGGTYSPTLTINGSPTTHPIPSSVNNFGGATSPNCQQYCYEWAWWFTANSSQANSSIAVTFNLNSGPSVEAIVDVLQLGGSNATTPIVAAATSTASGCNSFGCANNTSTATANLATGATAGDIAIEMISSDGNMNSSALTWTPAIPSAGDLFQNNNANGSLGVYMTSPAVQNEQTSSAGFSGTGDWGTIAFEIQP